ncbi:surface proteins containing Ig-like domains-like [Fimbriiglobus ruber]|uniref:Surface proteins containing Ig-like domains-like n=1 Tax=Fimbriiglobus ruber TaxID=1908690 RepID=A0A225DT69_9BACT|nr:surface proteins containing Ig-like domains-like [Fimbriiglobus ruber]
MIARPPFTVAVAGATDGADAGMQVKYTSTPSGGTGPFSYLWDDNTTGATDFRTYSSPGSVRAYVTVTDLGSSGGSGGSSTTASSYSNYVTVIGSTTTAVSAPTAVYGQAVTLTATVSPNSPATGSPTGSVTFEDGGVTIGSGTLSGGTATASVTLPAGTHAITAVYGGATYWNGSSGNTSETITPAPLTIAATSQTQTYGFGGTSAALGTTGFTTAGLLGSDSVSGVTLSTNAPTSTSGNYTAGAYTLTPSAASGSGLSNYTITYTTGSLTVARKSAPITGVSADDKVYDGTTAATLDTDDASVSGAVSGDAVAVAGGSGTFATANVGTGITVTATGFGLSGADAANYTLSGQPSGLSADITPATLDITADDQEITYGDDVPDLTYEVDGLVGDDSVSGAPATTATSTSNAGDYAITQGTLTASSNYTLTFTAGTLTIDTAELEIVADDQEMTYGDPVPGLTYEAYGLVNGDAVSGTPTTTAASTSNVGDYSIDQGTLTASSNYDVEYIPGTLTIDPATC